MSTTRRTRFSRRVPDHVTDELVAVLANKQTFGFNDLFEVGEGPFEPGSITLDMTRESFAATFNDAMASVPYAVGVNSHRGSLLTRHPGHMQWLMEDILATESLFFVDSYTTHESVALRIASENSVPSLKRDVFLDSDPAPEALEREFERLKSLARKRGLAVAIGHPYPATLDFLEREIPRLVEEGIELVPIRELIDFH